MFLIQKKQSGNTATDLADLFDNDSEIKLFVQNLNAETTSDDLQSFMYKNLNTDNMPFVFRPVSIMIIMKHLLIDK